MSVRTPVLSALAATLLAVTASACGSSSSSSKVDNSSPVSPGASSTSGSGLSGSPIVVGTVGSYSGAQASSEGGAAKTSKAWESWVNANGGINGRPVKLIIKDDAGSATKSLNAVKELVEQDHVVALVGPNSNEDIAWASYVSSKGIPVVGNLPLNTINLSNPNFYAPMANVVATFYGMLTAAKTQGDKFGFLYCAESPQCATLAGLIKGVGGAIGLKVPVTAKVSGTAPDYTAQCQALKDAKVNTFMVASGGAVAIRIAQACSSQGLKATQINFDGVVTPPFLKEPAMEGLLASEQTLWFDSSTPGGKEYQDAKKAYAPDLGDGDNANAAYAWLGGKLFEAAVKAAPAGEVTPASVKAGLKALKAETLGGMVPPFTFPADGKPGVFNCYYIVGIQNGAFTTPQGTKPACAPDALVAGVLSKLAG